MKIYHINSLEFHFHGRKNCFLFPWGNIGKMGHKSWSEVSFFISRLNCIFDKKAKGTVKGRATVTHQRSLLCAFFAFSGKKLYEQRVATISDDCEPFTFWFFLIHSTGFLHLLVIFPLASDVLFLFSNSKLGPQWGQRMLKSALIFPARNLEIF